MADAANLDELWAIVAKFKGRARQELELRWAKWELDLDNREVHEAVGALLARQVT